MIRFLISLFLFFLFLSVNAQNLIPNPSVEDYIDCPETLENIEGNVIPWQKFRGTPDYYNSCSQNELLGWNNTSGFQQPRTGNGYFGAFLYSLGLESAREYFGVELLEPLQVGSEYRLTFFSSLAYNPNGSAQFASNNIGSLLMVTNYLNTEEQDPTSNFSHYNYSEVQLDSINWVRHEYVFIADSAYNYVAFGNFFDDQNTEFQKLVDNEESGLCYYFFDDFCLTLSEEECELTSEISKENHNQRLLIFPNPSSGSEIHISASNIAIKTIYIMDLRGRIAYKIHRNSASSSFTINPNLRKGTYTLVIECSHGEIRKQVIIN